jgi:sugar phosphate permease
VAAGVINGMGSVGAVVQELVLGRMLKTEAVEYVFGTLLVSALAALACLAYLLWRGARGKTSV